MTTPNQPAPTWMELVGLGAFEIGGSGGGAGLPSFGQGVTSDAVTQVISGPATALMNIDGVAAQSDVLTLVSNYLSTLPLQALQMFQGFLPGKTAADFADVPTAVTTIMGALGLGNLSGTSTALARLMTDLMVLFDVFHITYQAGTSGDAPGTLGTNGKPTWYSCWNDILSMVGLWTGTSAPTTPAPTIGTAITAAGTAGSNGSSWSTRLTNDLLVLLDVFHVTYSSTQWNAAWADLLSLFGIVNSVSAPTNPTPTIGPAITSAQASATTATTNAATAQTTANTGVTNAATAQTKANTASTWATRLTNNLLVTSDVFHLTYAAGSSGDAPGTIWSGGGVGNGKVTWYSCWNDLLGLAGTVNAVTAPTDAAPTTGAVIAANTAAATTAGTNASIAIASNQSVVDQINQAMTGNPATGQSLTTVGPNMTSIPASNVQGILPATVTFGNSGSNFALANSMSISYTPNSTDTFVIATVPWYSSSASSGTSTCTFGGVAMTLVDQAVSSVYAGIYLHFDVFILKITAGAGAKTLAWANSSATGVDAGVMSFFAQKILNYNTTGGGISSSSPLTMSYTSLAPSPTSNRVIAAFSEIGSSKATWSGFTPGTAHINNGPAGGSGGVGLYAGDVLGSASALSFSATHGITGGPAGEWIGFVIEVSN